jgi:hypothetical protein
MKLLSHNKGRVTESPHLSTRQYSRIVGSWVGSIDLDPAAYGTHSLRRTKPTLIYRRTKNLRAVQLLLGKLRCNLAELVATAGPDGRRPAICSHSASRSKAVVDCCLSEH